MTTNAVNNTWTAGSVTKSTSWNRFYVYNGLNQTNITGDGTTVTLYWPSVPIDPSSGFSTSTGAYTIPTGHGGIWKFGAIVMWGGTISPAAGSIDVWIINHRSKGGTDYIYSRQGAVAYDSNGVIVPVDGVLKVSAGDAVSAQISSYCGSHTKVISVLGGSQNSAFWGVQLA